MDDINMKLVLHHSGYFIDSDGGPMSYFGGKVHVFDNVDVDTFFVLELIYMVKKLGICDYKQLFYRISTEDLVRGLRRLGTDQDVLKMFQYLASASTLELFVKHHVSHNVDTLYPILFLTDVPVNDDKNAQHPQSRDYKDDANNEDEENGDSSDENEPNKEGGNAFEEYAMNDKDSSEEELLTPNGFDEEGNGKPKYPEFKPEGRVRVVTLGLGPGLNEPSPPQAASGLQAAHEPQAIFTFLASTKGEDDPTDDDTMFDDNVENEPNEEGGNAFEEYAMNDKDSSEEELLTPNGSDEEGNGKPKYPEFKPEGLVPTLEELCPEGHYRFCVTHLYANFKKEIRGNELKSCVWKVAKAYTRVDWEKHMTKFHTRDRSILTMLEWIRRALMVRLHECMDKMMKYQGPICANIQTKIERSKIIEDYVHVAFKKETYLSTYEALINPLNGQNQWPKTGCEPLLPPELKRPTGRPQKQRIRDLDEPQNPFKLQRKCTSLKCSKFGVHGHNQRTCKGPVKGKKERAASLSKNVRTRQTFMGFRSDAISGDASTGGQQQQPPQRASTRKTSTPAATMRRDEVEQVLGNQASVNRDIVN
ncbi:uncharacterized protein LOC114267884 [Camellia sinensis]|uniref:uncharacterized protein LOC114267884 n=1 Tax=Camellia sinensis TaxID=4442 RepID=UPI00103683BD|nr:uncharacterized protein LOC114267884 [Camellia sinensis]